MIDLTIIRNTLIIASLVLLLLAAFNARSRVNLGWLGLALAFVVIFFWKVV